MKYAKMSLEERAAYEQGFDDGFILREEKDNIYRKPLKDVYLWSQEYKDLSPEGKKAFEEKFLSIFLQGKKKEPIPPLLIEDKDVICTERLYVTTLNPKFKEM